MAKAAPAAVAEVTEVPVAEVTSETPVESAASPEDVFADQIAKAKALETVRVEVVYPGLPTAQPALRVDH